MRKRLIRQRFLALEREEAADQLADTAAQLLRCLASHEVSAEPDTLCAPHAFPGRHTKPSTRRVVRLLTILMMSRARNLYTTRQEYGATLERIHTKRSVYFKSRGISLIVSNDDAVKTDALAFLAFPSEHYWRQIWSKTPLERLNREVKQRMDVVGIVPNEAAIVRLVG